MIVKEIGRIDNVIAWSKFLDKANVRYEELIPHSYTIEQLDNNKGFNREYMEVSFVPIILTSTPYLQEMAYKLNDLPENLQILNGVIDVKHETTYDYPVFILTDGQKSLFVFTGGYEYARFKSVIDQKSHDLVIEVCNEQKEVKNPLRHYRVWEGTDLFPVTALDFEEERVTIRKNGGLVSYAIKDIELMESVRLKDDRGKGIDMFEGDIFQDWQNKISIIRLVRDVFKFEAIDESYRYRADFHNVGKVIGNIHQHGELLQKKEA